MSFWKLVTVVTWGFSLGSMLGNFFTMYLMAGSRSFSERQAGLELVPSAHVCRGGARVLWRCTYVQVYAYGCHV